MCLNFLVATTLWKRIEVFACLMCAGNNQTGNARRLNLSRVRAYRSTATEELKEYIQDCRPRSRRPQVISRGTIRKALEYDLEVTTLRACCGTTK